jgi:hypothetical protein
MTQMTLPDGMAVRSYRGPNAFNIDAVVVWEDACIEGDPAVHLWSEMREHVVVRFAGQGWYLLATKYDNDYVIGIPRESVLHPHRVGPYDDPAVVLTIAAMDGLTWGERDADE